MIIEHYICIHLNFSSKVMKSLIYINNVMLSSCKCKGKGEQLFYFWEANCTGINVLFQRFCTTVSRFGLSVIEIIPQDRGNDLIVQPHHILTDQDSLFCHQTGNSTSTPSASPVQEPTKLRFDWWITEPI